MENSGIDHGLAKIDGNILKAKEVIFEKIDSLPIEVSDNPVFIGNLGEAVKRIELFKKCLPNVQPFYAVKCNGELPLLKILNSYELGFDCASQHEIETILNIGVSPDRIIFAHTIKKMSSLKYASKVMVKMMTVDCEDELTKIKAVYPDAEILVRIAVEDQENTLGVKMGEKFGVAPTSAKTLLQVAKKLDLNVIGVSFHVGVLCSDPSVFYDSVRNARKVFDAAADLGFNFTLLDVGGGFPGNEEKDGLFKEIAAQLNKAFDDFFPASTGVKIIAEPGTFFASSVYTLVCKVLVVKQPEQGPFRNEKKDQVHHYYINDGIWGSFFKKCLFNEIHPELIKDNDGGKLYPSKIWGVTCAPCDVLTDVYMLPKLQFGDFLMFRNFGDYTVSLKSRFNGFGAISIHYVSKETVYNGTEE